jgi:urease
LYLTPEPQVEATFPDGCKLVSLHGPICRTDGDLALALHGSFLPVPALSAFPAHPEEGLVPGHVLVERAVAVRLNAGREALQLTVLNTADNPVQVGSHYHFIEANPYLRFDRRASYGMRLNM